MSRILVWIETTGDVILHHVSRWPPIAVCPMLVVFSLGAMLYGLVWLFTPQKWDLR